MIGPDQPNIVAKIGALIFAGMMLFGLILIFAILAEKIQ